MKVLAVASEAFPLVKTGGLADVVGALPLALAPLGVETRTLLPGYPAVLKALPRSRTVHTFDNLMGGPARLRAATHGNGLSMLVLDAPHLFDREGTPYNAPDGTDWPDNPQRFAALGQAAAAVARGVLPTWRPEIVHAHDWQAGYTQAYLAFTEGPRTPSVFTVHNLAFQGYCPASMLATLGLPPAAFTVEGVEFYGGISPLKAGLRLADRITAVSPTYAGEITRPEEGQGLDGLLRARAAHLSGIINGIDTAVWDPARDPLIPHPFAGVQTRRRGRNKAALQRQLGLEPAPGALLFGIVSRLSHQKGIDLVLESLPALLALPGAPQLAILGAGDPALQTALERAAQDHPGRVGLRIGYDEATAHLIQAGADAILVPSRFEPCGLTQLCALRYGAVPVVARTGGLADTVIDANPAALAAGAATGVQFRPISPDGLIAALHRTAALWSDQASWTRLQRNAMRADVGWSRPAAAYAALYASIA